MSRELRKTYQLQIMLNGSKPPIWRRFLVDSSFTLAKFHEILQIVMGWTDSHMHQFSSKGRFYGVPDPDFEDSNTLNEKKYRLKQLLKEEKESIIYEYDFGDGWEHKITLEKILPFDPQSTLPRCVKAKGACPPEDIGGIWGYQDFLEGFQDPDHQQHEEYREWVADGFDPTAYDLEEVNQWLSQLA